MTEKQAMKKIEEAAANRPKVRHNLTERQRKYLKARSQGFNKGEASDIAGYSARNTNKIETSRAMAEALDEMMRNQGIDDEFLAKTIKEGLGATKPVVVDGSIHDYADYPARRQFVDVVLDIRGGRAKKELDVTSKGEKVEGFVIEYIDRSDEEKNKGNKRTKKDKRK